MSGITIIIVNYNVKYFLQQCLQAVYKSDYKGPLEVIVVDNDSKDGSEQMVNEAYPQVRFIANKENVGFSRANNQGITQAQHAYTLILNPDTIIQEDTLTHCARYMEAHPEVGALGVKMVDGSGAYLPESKRGFPTPMSALFKLTGLSKVFSKSAFFNSYYQGHLDNDETHEIEVLTGAFCFMPTPLLQEIGGFDEDYFMYGEDIELSYQVKERGYKLVYYPQTQIIHFKGESTKKLSRRYLQSFYGAMGIYAQKRNAGSFIWSMILQLGIIISAMVGIFKKIATSVMRPVLDIALLFTSTSLIRALWGQYYFQDRNYYQDANFSYLFLVLILIAVFSYYLFGQYDRRHNLKHLLYGFVFSTLGMLSVYSLLPLDLRFSRIVLLLVAVTTPFLLWLSRHVYNKLIYGTFSFDSQAAKRIGVVGRASSFVKIREIINRFSPESKLVGVISTDRDTEELGHYTDIKSIVDSRNINELIFCSSDLSTQDIFKSMSAVGSKTSFKVANNDNSSILGSDSKERVGEWYTLDIGYKIEAPFHKRTKRLLDLAFVLVSILFLPFVFLLAKQRLVIYKNIVSVLVGRQSWIGYDEADVRKEELPEIRKAVFPITAYTTFSKDAVGLHQSNLWYAKNYSTWAELAALLKICFR